MPPFIILLEKTKGTIYQILKDSSFRNPIKFIISPELITIDFKYLRPAADIQEI